MHYGLLSLEGKELSSLTMNTDVEENYLPQ